MLHNSSKSSGWFTIVKIVIVVAIIALLTALAMPFFLTGRKRSQATSVLEDLRMIDSAVDQYAMETKKTTGAAVKWADLQAYLKKGSTLYNSHHTDLLGSDFGETFSVHTIPIVPYRTFQALSDVAPAAFWSPFK